MAANRRAYQAAIPGNELGEAYHASDYSVYADLQLARDTDARADIANAFKVRIANRTLRPAAYAAAAMPARYALERGDWRAAMSLETTTGTVPFTEAIVWFARALGAARTGDIAAAQENAAHLGPLRQALVDAKDTYWATEVEVQQGTAAAWIALAQKRTDEAVALMQAAADLEDSHEKHIVTPGRVLPARELFGDMLLEAGKPVDALKAYEASQQREPNRFRGYYGAASAAAAAGDRRKAADYYGKLLALAKHADSNRPEIAQAKAFMKKG